VLVAVLIGIMISIVVGVSLIPVIQTSVSGVAALGACDNVSHPGILGVTGVAHGTYESVACSGTFVQVASAGLTSLVEVLPYVFVAVILLGAVAWIGGSQG